MAVVYNSQGCSQSVVEGLPSAGLPTMVSLTPAVLPALLPAWDDSPSDWQGLEMPLPVAYSRTAVTAWRLVLATYVVAVVVSSVGRMSSRAR